MEKGLRNYVYYSVDLMPLFIVNYGGFLALQVKQFQKKMGLLVSEYNLLMIYTIMHVMYLNTIY